MREMMGGFFGEEPLPESVGEMPLAEGPCCALLSSGRAALEVLLANLPSCPRALWVPRFLCDTLLQAPRRLGIPVRRYACDAQLRPLLPEGLGEADALLLVNYFGVTGESLVQAAARHHGPVLVDATTALGAPLPEGADGIFYSFRKFLPVADGGAALARYPLPLLPTETDDSRARMVYMRLRSEQGACAAAAAAQSAEDSLAAPPRLLSPQTRARLRRMPTAEYAARRRANYQQLHAALAPLNRLELPMQPECPMCYPLVTAIPDLRDSLVDAGTALPLYWPEVIEATEAHETENRLARTLLPLPLDQRYGEADMKRLLRLILG